jgi:hypothetical protein
MCNGLGEVRDCEKRLQELVLGLEEVALLELIVGKSWRESTEASNLCCLGVRET